MAADYYDILGLSKSASADEIQKAYRKLARKFHPDMNPDDKSAKENFQKVQQAYDTLGTPEKRKLYDQLGPQYEQMGAGGPGGPGAGPGGFRWGPGGGPGAGGVPPDVDLSDILGRMFGGGAPGAGAAGGFEFPFGGTEAPTTRGPNRRRGRARAAAPPSDTLREVTIPFTTAIQGGETSVVVRREDGEFGTLTVKIPPGVNDGAKLRLGGQGEAGPNGEPPGDLIVVIRIDSHPSFQRKGNDLVVRVPVSLSEAVLGAKIDVPTPRGTVALKVPPKTSSGKRLRVKGFGVQPKQGTPGDLFAEIQIVLPEPMDDDLLEAIRRQGEHAGADPRTDLRW